MGDKIILLASTCGCILVCGASGGFVGAWYRKITNSSPCPKNKKDYAFFSCTGIISAFGIMFLCATAGKLFNQPDLFDSCSFAIGVSLISGYFSMRLLPKLGNKLENDMNLLQKKVEETEAQARSAITYNQLISMAEMALTEKKPGELKTAIEAMSKAADMYPRDHMFNIYYSRLQRWSGDERGAILTARNVARFLSAAARSLRRLKNLPRSPAFPAMCRENARRFSAQVFFDRMRAILAAGPGT